MTTDATKKFIKPFKVLVEKLKETDRCFLEVDRDELELIAYNLLIGADIAMSRIDALEAEIALLKGESK